MSRTIRKHVKNFNEYYSYYINIIKHDQITKNHYKEFGFIPYNDWMPEYLRKESYRYHTDSKAKYDYNGIPKRYRKQVNRNRRNFDKRELYKAVKFEDYPEQCLDWNGKSNDHWCYY